MDDERIRQLTAEVLADLHPSATAAGSPAPGPGLESRVAALEGAVRQLQTGAVASAVAGSVAPFSGGRAPHPSARLLPVLSGGERCVMEPDRPCVESGMCRTFGH
jgi:hypothetical protein